MKKKKERRKKMSTESESAEQVVRLSLEGLEVVAKLTGSMAKNFAVMLYSMSQNSNKNKKGKTRLTNMLKSNSILTIFSIKKEDYPDFKKKAKQYGIQYSALYNKNAKTSDGLVDLIIKEEDAVRVNRVVERYNITKVDVEKVEKTLAEETKKEQNQNTEKPVIDKDIQEKNTSQDLLNKLLKKQNVKEENENTNPSNISSPEKDSPSENLLKTSEGNAKMMNNNEEKPSIIEKIERIKENNAQKEKEKEKELEVMVDTPKQPKANETKHEQPKIINKKDRKEQQK